MSLMEDDEDGFIGEWVDDSEEETQCLFTSRRFPNAKMAMQADLERHDFDISEFLSDLGVNDIYGAIKAVNAVRKEVKARGEDVIGPDEAKVLCKRIVEMGLPEGDDLLQPVLENDALLFSLQEFIPTREDENRKQYQDESESRQIHGDRRINVSESNTWSEEDVQQLCNENEELRNDLELAKQVIRQITAANEDGNKEEECLTKLGAYYGEPDIDTYYFASYASMGIHIEMLSDTERTGSYEKAICENPDLFQGKTILDVGCGTGILSMFAARAGASQVLGVDNSSIIDSARQVVEENGYTGTITLIQAQMEDAILPIEKVDVIISEWMGYALLYECMLPAVLAARDKYLAPGGTLFPDHCRLFVEGVRNPNRMGWWKDIHGIDYTILRPLVMNDACVETVQASQVVTSRELLKNFDLLTVSDLELDFEAPFSLTGSSAGPIDAILISFDVGFENACRNPVWFSTGPHAKPTHWKQTCLWIEPSKVPNLKKLGVLDGVIKLQRRPQNPRELNFELRWELRDGEEQISQNHESGKQTFIMA